MGLDLVDIRITKFHKTYLIPSKKIATIANICGVSIDLKH
jgi:hypothetical protein